LQFRLPAGDGPITNAHYGTTVVCGRELGLNPREKREEAWGRLATDLDLAKLNSMTSRARLEDVPSLAAEILAGKTRGRLVIDL
jgi:acrylyl-CoA reductase (NADPH)